ncbi:SpoIIE family protein phosphatase [Streptomyces sp. DH37]|uniref:SpoIIE family protein phosphatase n=1 Tax=Streptomyces sp. DH37 TaxID=3040122 RepID=UPI002441ED42|nr:SpoIIE family protein phosphatase [Streptomyces sp. DH37]MDG9700836.1 SpoIIE family protein phosphatase [Streptomyces sp. DH37]
MSLYVSYGHDGRSSDEEAVDGALAATVRQTGASAGAVYLLARDEPMLGLVVMCGVPAATASPWRRLPLVVAGPVSAAVRENRLVWVAGQEDMARDYPRAAAALPYRFALASAPLEGTRRRWGALLLVWSAGRPPHLTRRERGHIASSARRIAHLLDHAARPPTIPDQPRLVPVNDPGAPAAQSALAAADLVERLPVGTVALNLEGRVTYLNTAAAELLGSSTDRLLGTVPWQSLPWLDDPVYEDHYRAAVLSREPVAYTVLLPPDRWLDFRLYPDDSGISALITPGHTPGRAAAGPPGPAAAPFSAVASPVSVPAAAGRIHQLMHLAAALSETVSVRDVIGLVADQVLPAFGAQGMVMSAVDADRLRITGHRGYAPEAIELLDGLPLDTDLTPVGHALASGVPAFFANPREIARAYPRSPAVSGKQAWAFLPLIVSGRGVGCCVISYDRPHTFTAGERAVLTSLAGLIAQALDRARLYDTKHELAHGLQQALLPHNLPAPKGLQVAARYLPATYGMEIGGDFYDLIRLDEANTAAVIGDVQGHNTTAAALMGQVRTAVHAHATTGASPGAVLARTNRLLADLDPGLFTSCLYAHLDTARHRARLATAGHPPPLLRHPDGRAEVLRLPPGLLLGIDPGVHYPTIEIPLPPGTTLALYTDGLVEAPGTDIDDAIARLAHLLARAGQRDLDSLADDLVRSTTPPAPRADDIALLLIRASPGR